MVASRSSLGFAGLVAACLAAGTWSIAADAETANHFAYNRSLLVRPELFAAIWRPHYERY